MISIGNFHSEYFVGPSNSFRGHILAIPREEWHKHVAVAAVDPRGDELRDHRRRRRPAVDEAYLRAGIVKASFGEAPACRHSGGKGGGGVIAV